MSRVGRAPIPLPDRVEVNIQGSQVWVKGPKGELSRRFDPDMQIAQEDGHLVVRRPTDERRHRAVHGLTRALLANMVAGVTEGFSKVLVIEGVGYRAELQGAKLVMQLGYSHPIEFPPPPGIRFEVDRPGRVITISGIDKELVGEMAARIRRQRPPEPYKGKGVRYQDERVRRKAGKSGKVAKGKGK